jgi:proline iminopeptidase
MGAFLAHAFNPKAWVCARHAEQAPNVDDAGFNYYVQLRTELSASALPDPRPRLADNLTPSLILTAECDYIPWEVILQYKEALLNEKVFYFEDAGHMINLTQPSLMADVIRAFLLDTQFPIAPYASSDNPRPLVSP